MFCYYMYCYGIMYPSKFVIADDDGDGQAEEDCATPPPSMYINYVKLRTKRILYKLWSDAC